MKILIENSEIKLSRTKEADIPFIVESEQNDENANFIFQWTADQHRNAISDKDILHLIVKNKDNIAVGFIILKGMANTNNSIELTRIVITEKGLGYGKKVIALIQKWAFEQKVAHRLWLDVLEFNERARHLYESQGFVMEGTLRDVIKTQDTYQSLILMSMLKLEYLEKIKCKY